MEKFNPNPTNQPEKKSSFEKVKEKAGKFMKRVRQVTFVLILAGVTDYQATHNNTIESTNIQGKEVFKHSDKETTHILNYLSGVDSLPAEESLKFIKDGIRGYGTNVIDYPENFDAMSYDETINFLANYFYKKHHDENGASVQKFKDAFLDEIEQDFPRKYEYNDTIYKKLWEVEKECGSPKIRWTFGHNRHILNRDGKNDKESHYDAFTHTVFIGANSQGSYEQVDKLISEWSHAKQFHDHPTGSTLQFIHDGMRIATDVLKSKEKDFTASQLNEYNIPGSIEHDAHKVIEPYLKQKFANIKQLKNFRSLHKHKEE